MKELRHRRWVVVALVLAALAGCKGEPGPELSNRSTLSPEQALGAYAARLVQVRPQDLVRAGPAHQTLEAPRSYLTIFTAISPAMLTESSGVVDEAARRRNEAITQQWQDTYCTAEIQAILRQHGVKLASAQIVDEAGVRHSLAMCILRS